ncbi:hypothetical protein SBRCBS47491_005090 [Sporothrix bragantina]|uniref:C2 NT-type domain-containing protein n=1 Tax=Sporothrix bragantina TaxID=671064 RepID=A0ABP0BUM1_9PEZI
MARIYDLNNVPLVSGVSSVKWHLPHSIRSEHRGRTHKQPIANHRVEYDYARIIPLRFVVDRNNRLSDYPIEFEIVQEFEAHGAGRDEKIVLGKVSLNLAEYVAESEAIQRDTRPATSDSYGTREQSSGSPGAWHSRQRSSMSGKQSAYSNLGTSVGTIDSVASGPASTAGSSVASFSTSGGSPVEDGVIRRYLMQESKINSTLKIGILLVQTEGERNYVAPPLKSAPVFGGITGIVASSEAMNAGDTGFEDHEDYATVGGVVGAMMAGGPVAKGHENAEIQDVYRRALAASWACQAGEMPADECIEDIFSGGDGFRMSPDFSDMAAQHNKSRAPMPSGTSLGAVKERHGWSQSSPTASSIHEGDEEDDSIPSAPSRTSSGSKKHHNLLPKLGPIRRRTMPLSDSGSSKHHALASPLRGRFKDRSNNNGSSGEDGASGTGGGSGNTSGSNNNQDDDDDDDNGNFGGPGNTATLRPSDIRKFRGGAGGGLPASASASALTGRHRAPGRELSGLSDRTVTPHADLELPHMSAMAMALGSRSSRSSPGPQSPSTLSFNSRREEDFEASALASGSGNRGGSNPRRTIGGRVPSNGSRKSSGHGSGNGSGNGSGHDEHARQARVVHEYDVRDDYVAWQLPGSIAASS